MTRKNQKNTILLLFLACLVAFLGQGLFQGQDKDPSLPLPPRRKIQDLDRLSPETRVKAQEFLRATRAQGLDVLITETYRTQERQDWLYAQGRTRPGPKVTWTKKSKHSQGLAFDIAKAGPDPYGDHDFFRRCAEIGRDLGLTPGYYWKKQDKPHFQLDSAH